MTGQWNVQERGVDQRWIEDDLFVEDERSSSYPPDGLVTLRFLRDAVRRHLWLWVLIALAGLAAGVVAPVVLPPGSESSAKLLLTYNTADDRAWEMSTDVNLVSTHSVAKLAIARLNLDITPDELLERYAGTPMTDRVLEIKAGGSTSEEATRLADALARVYLDFRKDQIAQQEVPLRKDLAAAKTAVNKAEADVRKAGGNPDDPAPPPSPELTRLTQARQKQQYIEEQIVDQQISASRMSSSRILDPAAPIPSSERQAFVFSAGSGLVAGLFIGLGLVIVRALISDRLWRRQDISRALGTRVQLSIGRPPRRIGWFVRRAQLRKPEINRAVRHLADTIRWSDTPKPALSIVSVDDPDAGALVISALALRVAEEGKQVLVADLSGGSLDATLGVSAPGTHPSRLNGDGVRIAVHVPDPKAGPAEGLLTRPREASAAQDETLAATWASADVVLVLATLTPAIGAEHLRTWSPRAVALITAGRCTAAGLRSVGEMLRLAGIGLVSSIVLRGDRTDESVGSGDDEATASRTGTDVEMIGP